jgi:hypothetical protein
MNMIKKKRRRRVKMMRQKKLINHNGKPLMIMTLQHLIMSMDS